MFEIVPGKTLVYRLIDSIQEEYDTFVQELSQGFPLLANFPQDQVKLIGAILGASRIIPIVSSTLYLDRLGVRTSNFIYPIRNAQLERWKVCIQMNQIRQIRIDYLIAVEHDSLIDYLTIRSSIESRVIRIPVLRAVFVFLSSKLGENRRQVPDLILGNEWRMAWIYVLAL